MLVFTKLLLIFSVMILIFGICLYYVGYHFSGNTGLKYYPTNQLTNPTPTQSFNNFVQNGSTTLKYFGTFLILFFFIGILGALINEHFKFSQHLHHLKRNRPLHP